jgi:hypothetical protein
MGTGRATQAPDPQQYRGHLAGGGGIFYHCVCPRGYPREFLRAVLREITWGRRARILEPKQKERNAHFFETYRACVLTLRNAPEWPALKSQLDLSLKELVQLTYGDIFPPTVFFAHAMRHDWDLF